MIKDMKICRYAGMLMLIRRAVGAIEKDAITFSIALKNIIIKPLRREGY